MSLCHLYNWLSYYGYLWLTFMINDRLKSDFLCSGDPRRQSGDLLSPWPESLEQRTRKMKDQEQDVGRTKRIMKEDRMQELFLSVSVTTVWCSFPWKISHGLPVLGPFARWVGGRIPWQMRLALFRFRKAPVLFPCDGVYSPLFTLWRSWAKALLEVSNSFS